ncbi:MAG TPA: hypothetical protein VN316_01815 [candidate division Zixibacteria bacterium]|nr:hypothetical protein [candidate division Zixibacteria bacterium]
MIRQGVTWRDVGQIIGNRTIIRMSVLYQRYILPSIAIRQKFKVGTLNKFLLVLFLLSVPAAAVEVGASDTVRAGNDTEYSTGSGSYVQLSVISPVENTTGSVRITYDIRDWNGSQNAFGQLKKNGVNIGTEYITNSGVYVTRSEDISITLNTTDTLELWAHTAGGNGAYVRNFRLKYGYPIINVSGYVNYSNGTPAIGAKVGWYQNWTTTNATGYYKLFNMPKRDVVVVAGKEGYTPHGEIISFNDSNIIQDFTITSFSKPVTNPFMTLSDNVSNTYLSAFNSTGFYDPDHFSWDDAGYDERAAPEFLFLPLANVYAYGQNRTPEYFERVLSIMNEHDSQIRINSSQCCGYLQYYGYTHAEWYLWSQMEAYDSLVTLLSPSVLNKFNSTLRNWNPVYYRSYNQVYNDSVAMDNHALFEMVAEQLRIKYGLTSNTTYRDAIASKHKNQSRNQSGYLVPAQIDPLGIYIQNQERSPSTTYNIVETVLMMQMQDYGYDLDPEWNDITGQAKNMTYSMHLNDGDVLTQGRSSGVQSNMGIYALFNALLKTGASYRHMDIAFQKAVEYMGCNNITNIFCETRSFYNDIDMGYISILKINGAALMWFTQIGQIYDPSIVESPHNHTHLDNFNYSGWVIVHTEKYCFSMFPQFYPRSQPIPSGNGTLTIPMRMIATTKDAMNQTFAEMPEVTNGPHAYDQAYNFITFNNDSKLVYGLSVNRSNVTWSMSDNSLYMNWSKILVTSDGSVNGPGPITIPYFNISIRQIEDRLNITYTFNRSGLTGYRLPIDFLVDDNLTTATRNISGLNFTFIRGKETVYLTNFTAVNNAITLRNDDINSGLTPFGLVKKTYIDGTMTGSGDMISVAYDVKINTTNTYGYVLNQPPSVLTSAPASPYRTIVGQQATFSASFTQNNINVTWYINDTQVGQNNTVSGGTVVYYTRTGEAGAWLVNATGCNAQGCATQLWNWRVLPTGNISGRVLAK